MQINTKEEFDDFINKDYVLVDFYATWCGPCKMLSPILESLDSILVGKVDVDKNPILAREYGVMSIPTLMLFKKGELIDKKIGFIDMDLLKDWINNN